MTTEELMNNRELLEILTKETEEKIRAGQDPMQAKIEVLKAHGIETDEDAARAKIVGKMELSDEELQNVTGGEGFNCRTNYACYYTFMHHSADIKDEACLWSYNCAFINGSCDETISGAITL